MLRDCADSDGDGSPNYQDADDDGDDILTRLERSDAAASGNDVDLDGRANWLDSDADADELRDGLDGRQANARGVPNYLNPDAPSRTGGLSGGGCSVETGRSSSAWSWFSVAMLLLFRRARRSSARRNQPA